MPSSGEMGLFVVGYPPLSDATPFSSDYVQLQDRALRDATLQSAYSSLRQARGSAGWAFGVRLSKKE
jgi:hypothetical protein